MPELLVALVSARASSSSAKSAVWRARTLKRVEIPTMAPVTADVAWPSKLAPFRARSVSSRSSAASSARKQSYRRVRGAARYGVQTLNLKHTTQRNFTP